MCRARLEAAAWCAFVVVLLVPGIVATAASILQHHRTQQNKIDEQSDPAYVKQIIQISKSAEMRSFMDPDKSACENFYTFACGKWPKIYPANKDNMLDTDTFELVTQAYDQKLLALLTEGTYTDDGDAVIKVKHFFQDCRRDLEPKNYTIPLKLIIAEFGQMPGLLRNESRRFVENFDWLETIAAIQRKYGIPVIFQMETRTNWNFNEISLAPAPFEFVKISQQERIQKELEDYLGLEEAKATHLAAEIVDFELQLGNGLENASDNSTLVQISELQTLFAPEIDLDRYLKLVFDDEQFNSSLHYANQAYMENLSELLNRTSTTQLSNYIMFKLVREFYRHNEQDIESRDKLCLGETRKYFPELLDNMFVRHHKTQPLEEEVTKMWINLKNTFRSLLLANELDWISLMTRKLAIEKLDGMTLDILTYNERDFNTAYAALEIIGNHVENLKQVLSLQANRQRTQFYAPTEKPEVKMERNQISPLYLPQQNRVIMPILLLQPYYFLADAYPAALKYSTLGFMLAQALIQGFDETGQKYGTTGAAQHQEQIWWDRNSTAAYETRRQCFSKQYRRYRYQGEYLAVDNGQKDNIIYNAALRLSYKAYANQTVNIEQELLPNLSYNNKQLFFLSYAQFWCSDESADLIELNKSRNLVSLPRMYRVIGPLANFDEFSEAWHCGRGAFMNPATKCRVF